MEKSLPIRYNKSMATRKHPTTPERLQNPRSLPFSVPRWRGDLPHLTKEDCSYFVTFCEIHAVPSHVLRSRVSRERKPESIALAAEPDLYSGLCFLRRPEIADIVQNALLHFQTQRYDLHAWIVMPNRQLCGASHSWRYVKCRDMWSWCPESNPN